MAILSEALQCGTLLASSTSGLAIWRSSLRCAGASEAPKPGVEYAQEAPLSLAQKRKTCQSAQHSMLTYCSLFTGPEIGTKESTQHSQKESSTGTQVSSWHPRCGTLASVILKSWYAFWAMPRLRLENDCRIWLDPCKYNRFIRTHLKYLSSPTSQSS